MSNSIAMIMRYAIGQNGDGIYVRENTQNQEEVPTSANREGMLYEPERLACAD